MALALLAAAFFAQAPGAFELTARELNQACGWLIATTGSPPPVEGHPLTAEERGAADCRVAVAVEFISMLAEGEQNPARRSTCPPEAVLRSEDSVPAAARAYLDYFERTPAVRDDRDGTAALRQAITATWPCQR